MHIPTRILQRGSWPDARSVAAALRTETVGGALLLAAAALALILANSPLRESYFALRDTHIGPAGLHLDLSVGTWAADGLLAIFFFVAGLELKRELAVGDLRDPAKAAVPIIAAACGVAVPSLLFILVVLGGGGDAQALRGWAIPAATDIAFALAVLAVLGTHLPSALRAFLLTLAVVDDLIAITIIAVGYTSGLSLTPLALSLLPLLAFRVALQRGAAHWWLLIPLAVLTWALVHASGVHATVAGVVLGLVVPVRSDHAAGVARPLEERLDRRLRPISAGLAVPLFALFAAGVQVSGAGLGQALQDRAAVGVVLALVLGKLIGVFGGTYLTARFTHAELDTDLAWSDVLGLSLLAGIGFTVSLLITELAFDADPTRLDHVKTAVLLASMIASLLAAIVLRRRNATYRRIAELESIDADGDGVPDIYGDPAPSGEAR